MRHLHGRTAWVVGASSGIGAAVAEELLRRGCRVAISARDVAALHDVAHGDMQVAPADMTDAESLQRAVEEIRGSLGEIDIVVIAAGFWQRMAASSFDLATFTRHIDINVIGMANVIDTVLPRMLERNAGMLVGISSVAGYRGMPGAQGYGASKAAQLNLLESLRAGLHGSGVQVQTVAPGFVRTPMTATNTFPMPFIIDATDAARYIVDGIAKDKAEVVFPPRMTFVMKVARLVPQRMWARLMAPRGREAGA